MRCPGSADRNSSLSRPEAVTIRQHKAAVRRASSLARFTALVIKYTPQRHRRAPGSPSYARQGVSEEATNGGSTWKPGSPQKNSTRTFFWMSSRVRSSQRASRWWTSSPTIRSRRSLVERPGPLSRGAGREHEGEPVPGHDISLDNPTVACIELLQRGDIEFGEGELRGSRVAEHGCRGLSR